jgi:hypothetical protein
VINTDQNGAVLVVSLIHRGKSNARVVGVLFLSKNITEVIDGPDG